MQGPQTLPKANPIQRLDTGEVLVPSDIVKETPCRIAAVEMKPSVVKETPLALQGVKRLSMVTLQPDGEAERPGSAHRAALRTQTPLRFAKSVTPREDHHGERATDQAGASLQSTKPTGCFRSEHACQAEHDRRR